jgi:lipopolysaccharide transport system permease protein
MVVTNLKIVNREHTLGNLWWILEPLFWMLIYWLFVGVILNRGEANYPFFILCGLIPFRAFSMSQNQSVRSIVSKHALLLQIPIPKVFIPISFVLSNHIKLAFGLFILTGFSIFLYGFPSVRFFLLPVPIFFQVSIGCGFSLILSILGVIFKDLSTIMQFVTRALIFFSPILYSIERVPEKLQTLFMLNPVAIFVTLYRNIFMHEDTIHWNLMLIGLIESIIFLGIGLFVFYKMRHRIMKKL